MSSLVRGTPGKYGVNSGGCLSGTLSGVHDGDGCDGSCCGDGCGGDSDGNDGSGCG